VSIYLYPTLAKLTRVTIV